MPAVYHPIHASSAAASDFRPELASFRAAVSTVLLLVAGTHTSSADKSSSRHQQPISARSLASDIATRHPDTPNRLGSLCEWMLAAVSAADALVLRASATAETARHIGNDTVNIAEEARAATSALGSVLAAAGRSRRSLPRPPSIDDHEDDDNAQLACREFVHQVAAFSDAVLVTVAQATTTVDPTPPATAAVIAAPYLRPPSGAAAPKKPTTVAQTTVALLAELEDLIVAEEDARSARRAFLVRRERELLAAMPPNRPVPPPNIVTTTAPKSTASSPSTRGSSSSSSSRGPRARAATVSSGAGSGGGWPSSSRVSWAAAAPTKPMLQSPAGLPRRHSSSRAEFEAATAVPDPVLGPDTFHRDPRSPLGSPLAPYSDSPAVKPLSTDPSTTRQPTNEMFVRNPYMHRPLLDDASAYYHRHRYAETRVDLTERTERHCRACEQGFAFLERRVVCKDCRLTLHRSCYRDCRGGAAFACEVHSRPDDDDDARDLCPPSTIRRLSSWGGGSNKSLARGDGVAPVPLSLTVISSSSNRAAKPSGMV
ncbi:hypothetical protein BC828DRAFT_384292 [Blastocladiella britannica]|nr:hypothetical protein BC828DRAFT_384292 [Blastocladiella britannica]